MGLLNYTTTIEPEQTLSEIQKMLSRHGVQAMMTEYDGQQVSAVSFRISIDGRLMSFKLPCNWRQVAEIMKNPQARRNARIKKGETWDDQAIRVAWRIIKDWIEAQLALVEVNMVTIPQVFLPYAIMKNGQTLAEHVVNNPGFLLGDGNAS
jgi:hypothetical protein